MPLFQTLLVAATATLLALAAAARLERLRLDLARPLFWALLLAAGSLLSLATALHAKTGHAGTGFVTRHGWPKPFYFIYLPDDGPPSAAWNLLYFAGNSLFYAGAALIVWVAWRAIRR